MESYTLSETTMQDNLEMEGSLAKHLHSQNLWQVKLEWNLFQEVAGILKKDNKRKPK